MAGKCEIEFFKFMDARRLVSNESKKKYGMTHTFFGVNGYRVLTEDLMVRDRGAFHVSDEDYPAFKRLNLAALREGAYLNVMERPRYYSMLCVYVDIRFEEENDDYSNVRDAHDVHKGVIEVLGKFFSIGFGDDVVEVLMQKAKSASGMKDGFLIVYPGVIAGEFARMYVLR